MLIEQSTRSDSTVADRHLVGDFGNTIAQLGTYGMSEFESAKRPKTDVERL
jgi:hypothetical protein